MAASPEVPPNIDQALSAARDWSGWAYTLLGGIFGGGISIFGGGIVWGSLRSTVKQHTDEIRENRLRIEAVESARTTPGDRIDKKIEDLRSEMQMQHNQLMRALLSMAQGRHVPPE
jgi:hypothetical protein